MLTVAFESDCISHACIHKRFSEEVSEYKNDNGLDDLPLLRPK